MELRQTETRMARPIAGAAQVARRALEIVVGVLLVEREPSHTSKYEDLFHMPW
ncbi:MAG: hypothetical protein GXX94_03685 [Chloroflexi bacterium]|nr:hypothetical protein [Chloroflexota bacterium]